MNRKELLQIGRPAREPSAAKAIAFLKWIRKEEISVWDASRPDGWKYWKSEKYINKNLTEEELWDIFEEEHNF